jgi:hypothetical protein
MLWISLLMVFTGMRYKLKTIDFLMASEIFLLAILEFISWRLCVNDNYNGEVKTSQYMLFIYPLLCTIGFLIVAIGKVAKSIKFKVCIYTKIVSWLFLCVQLLNLSSLFLFDIKIYNILVYPIFVIGIMGITIIKAVSWVLSKR